MTVIKIKNSSIAGKEPTAAQLQTAELAVNLTDAKLYTKDAAGNIVALGGSTGSGGTGDRPDSPSVGDLFFDTDLGVLLYWDGSAWQEVAGDIEVPTSQPGAPEDGQLWWNTDDNTLYIWYEDGDTGQWVIAVPQGLGSDFDETVADGLYVKQTGDNMTGDLTLGTDKITLDATDGSASFAGNLAARVPGETPLTLLTPEGSITAMRYDNNEYRTVEINTIEDHTTITYKNAGDTWWYTSAQGSAYHISYGTDVDANRVCTFSTDGSAEFAGDFFTFGDLNFQSPQTSQSGVAFRYGTIKAKRDDNSSFNIWSGLDVAGDETSAIMGDGSATFAGTVVVDASNYGIKGVANGNNSGAFGSVIGQAMNASGRCWIGQNPSGAVTSKIFADGTIDASNVRFNLEPDNDANYTVTTSTDEEGNTVETRVYNGPTLDVKERLQNLLARVDAMEANELIDDATDSSLLTLVSNLDTRLSNIETRLAALEGVS
jgi:hypothetical protein